MTFHKCALLRHRVCALHYAWVLLLWSLHCTSSLNGPTLASFCLFLVFSKKQYNFTYKSMWKMSFPSNIWCQDLNPKPLEHELSPITTRPGLTVPVSAFKWSIKIVASPLAMIMFWLASLFWRCTSRSCLICCLRLAGRFKTTNHIPMHMRIRTRLQIQSCYLHSPELNSLVGIVRLREQPYRPHGKSTYEIVHF